MSPTNCCTGFTRSELMRHGVAQAGRGLPQIEAGMPTPAGTGLTRRTMLAGSLGAALSVYGASKLGLSSLAEGIAEAATRPAAPVLVSIFMPGGLDGMSVLAPVGDPRYATLRPTLKLAAGSGQPFAEDPRLMWAPGASALSTLHGEGKVAVASAIGYDHPDQSHFTSRHFWEVGDTDVSGQYGWLGRYLDLHGSPTNPLQGLSLDNSLSPTLATGTNPVAAVDDPTQFDLWAPGVSDPVATQLFEAIGDLGRLPTSDPSRLVARTVATEVDSLRTSFAPYQATDSKPGFTSPVAYPTGDFGTRLSAVAALLAGGLPLQCVTVDASGSFDTHSGQASTLPNDLKTTCDGVLAFQRDLEARGLANRVITLVWSEFGRRPQENGSGTDHGAGGVGFLIGSSVKGTQLGEFPGLATLDSSSNLRSTFDFRSLYCGLLEQWFGVDAAPIIPGAASFARPTLLS